MPEYQVHILNWPIEADSPEGAAREAAAAILCDPTNFFFTVTDQIVDLLPSDSGQFEVREDFDSALFVEYGNEYGLEEADEWREDWRDKQADYEEAK